MTAGEWLESGLPEVRRQLRVLTVLVALVGLTAFGLGWFLVARRGSAPPLAAVAIAVLTAVAILVLTEGWVVHNRRIYRRKGPRQQVPASGYDYGRDRLGRPVVHRASVNRAREIVIEVVDGTKIYRSEVPS